MTNPKVALVIDHDPATAATNNEAPSLAELEQRRQTLNAAGNLLGGIDNETTVDALADAADNIARAILQTPARTLDELLIKAELWRAAGSGEGEIPDHSHLAELWPVFVADITRLAGSARLVA